jgi:2-(1,2-epoxy-1,2-dihydrophenyl)acetyl-CoA isomerase
MSIKITHDDGIATVCLDRADKLNALSMEMYHELADAFTELNNDDKVRVVLLTGAGRAFCAGGDVGSMASFDVVSGRKRSKSHHRMILALHHLEKPVIAAVRGPAAGIGASLALACDLIVASETAYLLMAFKNVGIPPDGGAIYFLGAGNGFLIPSYISEDCPPLIGVPVEVLKRAERDPRALESHLRLSRVTADEGILGHCLAGL